MAQERRPGGLGRGGIQVRTIHRHAGGARDEDASGSRASSSARPKGKVKKASVRYREKALGAARPGENFFPDAKMAEEFERRVLEIYAPTPDLNESTRDLPLRLQARRDGRAFKLPRLGQMCLEIASKHFATKVLPLLQRDEQLSCSGTAPGVQLPTRKKRRKVGIFGLPIDEEDEDEDFIPDAIDAPILAKGKRPRRAVLSSSDKEVLEDVHESNSYLLTILPTAAKEALQKMLEKRSPQHLSCYVLAKSFLTKTSVQASKSFRALSTVDGLGDRGIASLLRSLAHQAGDKMHTRPAASLVRLHLQAFTRLTTSQLLQIFDLTVNLREVCLRGCISIDAGAMKRLVKSCGRTLRVVNLNWTGVRVEGIEEIIRGCPDLEVLKIAHVQNLNDTTVTGMMDRITRATIEEGIVPLGKLKKLKITGTQIGIVGLGSLLKHCGNNLESLDISYTRVGGEGALQILLVLLGCETNLDPLSTPVTLNNTLRKLNLSGLSLPHDDLCTIWLGSLRALQVFDFKQMRTHPQASGTHDLAVGIRNSLLVILMLSLGSLAEERRREREQLSRNAGITQTFSFERVSISNKVILDKDFRYVSPISSLVIASVRHLDFSGADLAHVDWDQLSRSDISGCESLNLSGCLLPEHPPWELFGAAGRLQRIDLSGTKVSEQDVERLLELNPYLASINLTGCRGIPVTRRRKYFETMQ